jgi:microcystin-dependent protein
MSQPFLGEMKWVGFNFPPKGWSLCNGQFLPINQNQALFSILGTSYGGNGQTTFALPDMRGRVAMGWGGGSISINGQAGGESAHTLNMSEMPAHNHIAQGTSAAAGSINPNNGTLAAPARVNMYGSPQNNAVALNPSSISNVGGSQAHNNMSPYLVLNCIIALQGIFPSRN